MSRDLHPLAPLLFLPGLAALWLGIVGGLAVVSGWHSLGHRFRSASPKSGQEFRGASGAIGASTRLPVGYRNCLNVAVNEAGVGLSVLFLFRVLSPQLFIPWDQVTGVGRERIFLANYIVVGIRGTNIRISLKDLPGQAVLDAYQRYVDGRKAQP